MLSSSEHEQHQIVLRAKAGVGSGPKPPILVQDGLCTLGSTGCSRNPTGAATEALWTPTP